MARTTRGKGEGSIYKRADGYWVGSMENGRYPNGKRRRARVVRRHKDDVIAALRGMQNEKALRGHLPDKTWRVDRYLDYWLTDVIAGEITEGSLTEYRKRVVRIKPIIGYLKLHKLTKGHVQVLANRLAEQYPRSRKTQQTTLATFKQALRWAVPELIPVSPAEYIKAPKSRQVKVDDALNQRQAAAVLAAAAGDRYEALYWLALKYGLRIGELIALAWADLAVDDWDADATAEDELTVADAKSPAGVRTLPLIPEGKRQLAAHRARAIAAGRLPVGPVFVGPEGGKLKPQRVRAWFSDVLDAAGIDHLCRNCGSDDACSSNTRRFHMSRHTAAQLLIADGVDLNVVSAILGHANIGITNDIYAKVRADLMRKGMTG